MIGNRQVKMTPRSSVRVSSCLHQLCLALEEPNQVACPATPLTSVFEGCKLRESNVSQYFRPAASGGVEEAGLSSRGSESGPLPDYEHTKMKVGRLTNGPLETHCVCPTGLGWTAHVCPLTLI